jgi:uncharacterized membrane protein
MSADVNGLALVRTGLIIYVSSMLPMIAMHGAIILAAAMKVPWFFALLLSFSGSFTVASLLLRIDRDTLEKLRKYKIFNTFFNAMDRWIEKHSDGIQKHAYRSLAMIVGIPFTGVGVSVACGIAILLDLDYDRTLLSLLAGVLVYGALTTATVYGLFTGVRTLLAAFL